MLDTNTKVSLLILIPIDKKALLIANDQISQT